MPNWLWSVGIVLTVFGCNPTFEVKTIRLKFKDNTFPSVQLIAADNSPVVTSSPLVVEAVFSEAVIGFDPTSILVTNGKVQNFQGSKSNYRFEVVPIQQGAFTVSLPKGAAKDSARHESLPSNSIEKIYDSIKPVVEFKDIAPRDLHWDRQPVINALVSEDGKVQLFSDIDCTVAASDKYDAKISESIAIRANELVPFSKTTFFLKAEDLAGLQSDCILGASYQNVIRFVNPNPSPTGNPNSAFQAVGQLAEDNILVTDSRAIINGIVNAGAIYVFNGKTGELVSAVYGKSVNDFVGTSAIILPNGNAVVTNLGWDCTAEAGCDGTYTDAGSVTFINGRTGLNGFVSASNSLVGTSNNDYIGLNNVKVLSNGNYFVGSSTWDCKISQGCTGDFADAGALTWGSGLVGVSGTISTSNSLVGSSVDDQFSKSTAVLANGSMVAVADSIDCTLAIGCLAAAANVGAITWVRGDQPTTGFVTTSNSLFGTTANDLIGYSFPIPLTNGGAVIASYNWDCQISLGCGNAAVNAGAVTWISGTSTLSGFVNSSNSLIGTTANDSVGSGGVIALANGHYVVGSYQWTCQTTLGCAGTIASAGAVTWGNGITGTFGQVAASNSMIGDSPSDRVGVNSGIPSMRALTNGNFVFPSITWDCKVSLGCPGSATDAGAVTWCSGSGPCVGIVSASNSIVGSSANDGVGSTVSSLSNGNYVSASDTWDCLLSVGCSSDYSNAGAVTWGNGATGTNGIVSPTNSLVGSGINSQVGESLYSSVNGNYLIISEFWQCDATSGCGTTISMAGAITLGNGTSGTSGVVSKSNSIVGTYGLDLFGARAIPLDSGDFVVTAHRKACTAVEGCAGTFSQAGAVVYVSGTNLTPGLIDSSNSALGSVASEQLGGSFSSKTTALSGGKYLIRNDKWNCSVTKGCSSDVASVGMVSIGSKEKPILGFQNALSGIRGTRLNDKLGNSGSFFELADKSLIVGGSLWGDLDEGLLIKVPGFASLSAAF